MINASPTPKPLIFNGKFLSAPMTGVHRVAYELIGATHALVQATPELKRQYTMEVWYPHDGEEHALKLDVPKRMVGPLRGIPWEQLTLPYRAGSKTLINLCNVGPMCHSQSITMFHDAQVNITPESYSRAFRIWYALHQKVSGRVNKRILTVSDYSRGQLAHFGKAPTSKITTIHNGVDHVLAIEPDASVLSRLELMPKGYVVGLANTQKHKNIEVLLKAFAQDALKDMTLVLVGSATREDFAKLGLPTPENVIFAGRVSDEELRGLYEQALALCFPSLTEGFGLPPLEAMITGCPSIVTTLGALPEVCGDVALYADAFDPDAWVSSILQLCADENAYNVRAERSRTHAAQFTWERAARQLLNVIESA